MFNINEVRLSSGQRLTQHFILIVLSICLYSVWKLSYTWIIQKHGKKIHKYTRKKTGSYLGCRMKQNINKSLSLRH